MLILASASPRRQELLRQIGCQNFRIAAPAIDETPLAQELPLRYAARLAQAKAHAIAQKNPTGFVLAADTVVAVGRRILGKAENADTARRFLTLLSGRQHRVLTAVHFIRPNLTPSASVAMTRLKFKRLSLGEIDAYLASNEWQDKAGAYAIQGRAGAWVEKMQGCYFNVVGLPLAPVYRWLRQDGLL